MLQWVSSSCGRFLVKQTPPSASASTRVEYPFSVGSWAMLGESSFGSSLLVDTMGELVLESFSGSLVSENTMGEGEGLRDSPTLSWPPFPRGRFNLLEN